MSARFSSPARHAGIMVPLFSIHSTSSWGIGEIQDLLPLGAWLRSAGLDFVQLLPLNEMSIGQASPYSAMSAMALDPIFVHLPGVPEFAALGGEASLTTEARRTLDDVRRAPRVEHQAVRQLKTEALRAAYDRFRQRELRRGTPRATAFEAFKAREREWLEPYALFRALHAAYDDHAWWDWPVKARTPETAAGRRRTLAKEIGFVEYQQWVADEQWHAAREALGGIGVFGDLPFMVSRDSADVWGRQHAFMHDATVGVPPDAFSDTGQDWGLPVYRWDVMAGEDFAWFRERARRTADLFDGYRVDHLVGLYRTYVRPLDGKTPYFVPAEEADQTALGETVLGVFLESGATVIAEDLGTVPDFVRASMRALDIPGFSVLRWERAWKSPGEPFLDPRHYPVTSVATTGTHDTESMAVWWDEAPAELRAAFAELPLVRERAISTRSGYGPALRDAVLELMLGARSRLVILPLQDIFGWTDRINVPATVGETNWTWRVKWPVDRWHLEPEAAERAAVLSRLSCQYGRTRAEAPAEGRAG